MGRRLQLRWAHDCIFESSNTPVADDDPVPQLDTVEFAGLSKVIQSPGGVYTGAKDTRQSRRDRRSSAPYSLTGVVFYRLRSPSRYLGDRPPSQSMDPVGQPYRTPFDACKPTGQGRRHRSESCSRGSTRDVFGVDRRTTLVDQRDQFSSIRQFSRPRRIANWLVWTHQRSAWFNKEVQLCGRLVLHLVDNSDIFLPIQ
jgi:hypothetical protein